MTRDKMLGKTSRIVGLCSIANFINAADRVIMPIAIVPMTDQFKWSLHWQGWILSAFAFGYFTSQVIGACAANRFGGKTVLFFAVFLWSVSTSVTPLLATSIPALIFCRVLLGLGEGLGLPTIFHIFAHSVPIEERSRAFGYLVAAGSVGQTVASILCPHLAWQTSFYLFGTLGIVWVFIWLVFHNENTTLAKDEIPLFVPKVTNTNVRWTEFVCHWPLWAVYVAHFAMNWSNYIIMQWLPTYLSRNLGANKESISLTAVPYIVNSLVGIVAGHFADTLVSRRWSVLSVRRLMTSVGLIGPGVFLLAFCAVDNLLFAVVFVSISMGLCACNSAGHLSNHADIAPNHAGITFAISNTLTFSRNNRLRSYMSQYSMIPIVVQNGTPLIWNASDWLKLREEHRIVGNLLGCLVGLPRQETFKGLPVALLQEEVSLLLENNLAYIVGDSHLSALPTLKSKEKYNSYKEENKIEQVKYYEQQRKEQITSMIDRIIEGKRRKLLGMNTKKRSIKEGNIKVEEITTPETELDRETILTNELEKSTATSNPPLLVQTFTSEIWMSDTENEKKQWKYPETSYEKVKYLVFKDLWNKGFYITEGHKFGVDYLVYPGDPVKFHAQFLVVCMEYCASLSTVDLSAYSRLGSISRKTFVIATQPPNEENILYQSIQWTEKN